MPEEVLFETERKESLSSVADYLRAVADKLESGDGVTLSAGSQELTMHPPGTVEFEVTAEREGASGGPYERSLELELEWDENATDDGNLAIE